MDKGDRVMLTQTASYVSKGTTGVIVEAPWGSDVKVALDGGKSAWINKKFLAKI